jgi:signal transduction histidine kinase
MQDPSVGEKQMEAIHALNQSARKLSRLNQTLLLLAKISNRQFDNTQETDMTIAVRHRAASFYDRAEFRDLKLEVHAEENVKWKLNSSLSEILLNNLLSNAVRHTPGGGGIKVQLTHNSLVVSNSGSPMSDPGKVFERFYKENQSSESTGLGLSIVKQICDSSDLSLTYNYIDGQHMFSVSRK